MRTALFIFFILTGRLTWSQPDSTGRGYFSFGYDNDFFNATDRYFTQGIRLEFSHRVFRYSPGSKVLVGLKNKTFVQYGLAAEQQCYTPSSIRRDTVFRGERPFAAVMFLSSLKRTVDQTKQQSITSQMDLGILGPCAVCEQEQKGLHRWLDNIQPLGWQYQLNHAPVINYNVLYEKGILTKRHVELIGSGQLRVGTLYDDAAMGLMVRAGWMPGYFSKPWRSQPFRFYGFIKGNFKAVVYNATLQGGVFSNNIYTLPGSDLSRLVGSGGGGIVIAYKKISLEYTRIFTLNEFKYGLDHGWGHCEVRVFF